MTIRPALPSTASEGGCAGPTSENGAVDKLPPPPPGPVPPLPSTMRPDERSPSALSTETAVPVDRGARPLPILPGYQVLEVLGRGGMGVVYKARQIQLDRFVCIKMILVGPHESPLQRQRFLAEAEAVARLQHPNVVQIHEVGEHEGWPYFSMEFCSGGSLDKKLHGTPLAPRDAAQLAETLSRTVHVAHLAGIVHRDLKPANVLLSADGTVKITDFGFAKRLDLDHGRTPDGTVFGTPGYMAPEQAAGKATETGPATDTYALGAILYELLTGRPPFKAATEVETVLQVVSDEPVPPTRLNSYVPRDLETVCLKCLEKEIPKRYSSAEDLAKDLRRYLEGRPIAARPVGTVGRSWRWCRRNPMVASLMAAVTVSLLAGMAVASYFAVQARKEKLRSDHRLYVSDMRLAQRAWEDTQIDRLLELLEGQRPEQTGGNDLRGFEWYYWWRLSHSDLVTLRAAHAYSVLSVAISRDGRLASGGMDGLVKVWDTSAGQEIFQKKIHSSSLQRIALRPDGKRIAAAGGALPNPEKPGDLQVWDVETGEEGPAFQGHTREVLDVAYSADGLRLASASADETVRVWNADTGIELLQIKGCGYVRSVAFSPDGKRIAAGCGDDMVRVWDAASAEELFAFQGHAGPVFRVAFSPDGEHLASASSDHTAKVWDLTTRQALTLAGHNDSVNCVAYSPDGGRLATASHDRTIKVWDAVGGKEILTFKGHADYVECVAFTPDGKQLASGGGDRTVRMWDLALEQEVRTLTKQAGMINTIALSPDSRYVAGALEFRRGGDGSAPPGEVKVWDATTGQESLSFREHTAAIYCVAYSPDGEKLASAGGGFEFKDKKVHKWGEVLVWDATSGTQLFSLDGHTDRVTSVAFSPDGNRLATAAWDHTVKIWNAHTGEEERTFTDHTDTVWCVAFSPNGKLLASASRDFTVRVWDLATGRQVVSFDAHTASVNSVAFSPDSKRLASASGDQTVKVWDVPGGKELVTLRGHRLSVMDVAFSPDGRRLASFSLDGNIKLWDMATNQEVLTLKGGGHRLIFSKDGGFLAGAGYDGTVSIWDARPLPHSPP